MSDQNTSPGYRIFGSPHRYLQGHAALEALPGWSDQLGGRPLFITDALAWSLVHARLLNAYAGNGDVKAQLAFVGFSGEITHQSIRENVEKSAPHAPTVIIAIGGGKALDMGKAVSHALGCPVITVPTIASTDAPTSNSFAIYNEAHRLIAVERMSRNPYLVLVDTGIIARAPARFLRAGIGDAIAKKFEGEAAFHAGANSSHKTRPLRISLSIGDFCYQTIRTFSAEALAAVDLGKTSQALENVVEACILGSGLGFENTGLSIAHAMTRGLMASPETRQAMHGEHVAYGLLIQLLLETRPADFMDDLLKFYEDIGLPRSLAQLGQTSAITPEIIDGIVLPSLDAPHITNAPIPISKARMIAAIETLERRSVQ